MEFIQNIIYFYNPINLHINDIVCYDDIIKKIHLDYISNRLYHIESYFIDRFGDNRVLFEMRNKINVYNCIMDEIRKIKY
jgi:hypothetical protein